MLINKQPAGSHALPHKLTMKLLALLAFLLLITLATSIKTSSSTAVFTHRKLNPDKQQQKDVTTANINHQLNNNNNNNNAMRVANGNGAAIGDEEIGAKKDLDMENHHTTDATVWIAAHTGPVPERKN